MYVAKTPIINSLFKRYLNINRYSYEDFSIEYLQIEVAKEIDNEILKAMREGFTKKWTS